MLLRIGLEGRQAEDGELRREFRKLVRSGRISNVTDEQRMPGQFGINAGLDAVLGIGAAIEILREQGHALGMGEEILVQHVELLGGELAVLVPPDIVLGRLVADDEFVLGLRPVWTPVSAQIGPP